MDGAQALREARGAHEGAHCWVWCGIVSRVVEVVVVVLYEVVMSLETFGHGPRRGALEWRARGMVRHGVSMLSRYGRGNSFN